MYNIKPTCLFESHVILEIKKTSSWIFSTPLRFESHVMEDTLTGVLFLCSKCSAPIQRPKRLNFHQWRFPR